MERLKREERKCTECDSGEGEDVKDFLMRCYAWNGERMVFSHQLAQYITYTHGGHYLQLALVELLSMPTVPYYVYI